MGFGFYRNEDKEFSGCNRAMELLTGKSENSWCILKPKQDVPPEAAGGVVLKTDEKCYSAITSPDLRRTVAGLSGRTKGLLSKFVKCLITTVSVNQALRDLVDTERKRQTRFRSAPAATRPRVISNDQS